MRKSKSRWFSGMTVLTITPPARSPSSLSVNVTTPVPVPGDATASERYPGVLPQCQITVSSLSFSIPQPKPLLRFSFESTGTGELVSERSACRGRANRNRTHPHRHDHRESTPAFGRRIKKRPGGTRTIARWTEYQAASGRQRNRLAIAADSENRQYS